MSTAAGAEPTAPATVDARVGLAIRLAVTMATAASLALIAPPLNLHWLHWFVFLPMFWVLEEGRNRRNALLGWLFGTVAVGVIFRWIVATIALFSNIPIPGALAILVLFAAVFGAPYVLLWTSVHPIRRRLGDLWILLVPAWQVVIEWISQYVLLFPYNQGVSQYRQPFVWQLVSITGIWGMTFLILFVNCALAEAIYRRREGRPLPIRWMASAVIAWSVVTIYGAWRQDHVETALRDAPVLRVAQLQSSETMLERLQEMPQDSFRFWASQTATIPPGSVDMVVWPEGASLYSLDQAEVANVFARLARNGRFEMIVGSGHRDRTPGHREGFDLAGHDTGYAAFNSVFHVTKDGAVDGRYDKMVPLPFGEYMPLAHTLPWLVDWIQGPGDFQAGTQAVILGAPPHRIATPICYEAILSGVCRRFPQPDLFVTVTNDAWFGDTAAPWQHAMLAAVRATELGVPMYRAGYTGVSMAVEPDGTIYAETQPFTDVRRVVGVRLKTFPTFYAQFGDWFVVLCAGALLTAWFATRPRRVDDAPRA